jgi:hypothetical protein
VIRLPAVADGGQAVVAPASKTIRVVGLRRGSRHNRVGTFLGRCDPAVMPERIVRRASSAGSPARSAELASAVATARGGSSPAATSWPRVNAARLRVSLPAPAAAPPGPQLTRSAPSARARHPQQPSAFTLSRSLTRAKARAQAAGCLPAVTKGATVRAEAHTGRSCRLRARPSGAP